MRRSGSDLEGLLAIGLIMRAVLDLGEAPEQDGVGARCDASRSVEEAEVAGLAHGGEVGVGVQLVFCGAETRAVFDAQQVPDGEVVGNGAEYASATVAIEDSGLLRRVGPWRSVLTVRLR